MGAGTTSPREMELKQRLEALREEAARLEEEISAIHAAGQLNLPSARTPTKMESDSPDGLFPNTPASD